MPRGDRQGAPGLFRVLGLGQCEFYVEGSVEL